MPIFLNGLGLRNYRGIGANEQEMAPFKTFNIFIGANNSGKSSVLNFLSKFLNIVGTGTSPPAFEPLELHEKSDHVRVFAATTTEKVIEALAARTQSLQRDGLIKKLVDGMGKNGLMWLETVLPGNAPWTFRDWPNDPKALLLEQHEWRDLWNQLTGSGGGGLQVWIDQTKQRMTNVELLHFPKVNLIPAIRKIGPPRSPLSDYSGEGLIDKLAEIQNPNYDRLNDRKLFDEINAFLQEVTSNQTAHIQIPNAREHILVHMNGKTLPLSSLGTGIHEVIMIASFCTLSQNEIVCIEEPELHLHPLLQKKLVRYLATKTTNQYFIATHSPSFIDTPGAAIFHVRNEDGQTKITESVLRTEMYAICDDLGHKASELVQSNAVIWVEGPSDRIYLKHWVAALDPDLVEGIHYSIIFYGGRLLSHLTIERDEIQEFIDLRALNRNVAIVIDSDKESSSDSVNQTKARITQEFKSGGSVAWVTEGREIENYIEHTLLQTCVRETHPRLYGEGIKSDQFSHALHFTPSAEAAASRKNGAAAITEIDKVAVAKAVTLRAANLDVLDLRSRVTELVEMIRTANNF